MRDEAVGPEYDLPSFDGVRRQLVKAERGAGWPALCRDLGWYLVLCRELADALAELLRSEDAVLEVCSGHGQLAAALQERGVPVMATDMCERPEKNVRGLLVQEALERFRPQTVLASFRPIDACIDEAVVACPSIEQYIVLQSTHNGRPLGWLNARGWQVERLDGVERWMVTRDDVWVPAMAGQILQHGEAWRVRRTAAAGGVCDSAGCERAASLDRLQRAATYSKTGPPG